MTCSRNAQLAWRISGKVHCVVVVGCVSAPMTPNLVETRAASQLEPNVRYALCTWHELTDSPSVIAVRWPKDFFGQPLF